MQCPACARDNVEEARVCAGCGAALGQGDSTRELASGTSLHNGAYSVSRCLAREGLTLTYDGMDLLQHRFVTIVEWFPEGCTRQQGSLVAGGAWTDATCQETRRKFVDDAQVLARIRDQPAVPRVLGTFEEHNTAYVVMEHLQGKDLGSLLQQRGGKLPEGEAVGHVTTLGEGLHALHRAGMLHLDIQLRNIILLETAQGRTSRVVLAGWGERGTAPSGQRPGAARTYAAPEMSTSQPRGPATDVFALAAVLYHLLTGVPPAGARERGQGRPLADVRQVNPWVSARVAAAIMRGLALEPGRRPQSVREFVDALRFGGPAVSMTSPAPRSHRSPSPRPSSKASTRDRPGRPPASAAPGGTGGTAEQETVEGPAAETPLTVQPQPRRPWTTIMLAACFFAAVVGGILAALMTVEPTPPQAARSPRKGSPARPTPSPSLQGQARLALPWTLSLQGHTDGVVAMAFAPDGNQVLSGSADHTARLWDLASGKVVQSFQHGGTVRGVAFSPDGSRIATSSMDGNLRVWTPQGRIITRIQTGADPCNVVFSADGRLVLGRGAYPLVCVWDAETGALVSSVRREGKVALVAFSDGGARVVSVDVVPATPDGPLTIKVNDLRTGQVATTIRYAEPGIGVRRPFDLPYACLSADAGRAFSHGPSAREEDELVTWDVKTGRLANRHRILYLGDTLAISPDGTLALLSVEMRATIWDLAGGRELCRFDDNPTVLHCAAFSADGRKFAAGGHDRTVKVGTIP